MSQTTDGQNLSSYADDQPADPQRADSSCPLSCTRCPDTCGICDRTLQRCDYCDRASAPGKPLHADDLGDECPGAVGDSHDPSAYAADLTDLILGNNTPHPLDQRYFLRNEDGARIQITAAGVRRMLHGYLEDCDKNPSDPIIAEVATELAEIAEHYVKFLVPRTWDDARRTRQRVLREVIAEARGVVIHEQRAGRRAWLGEHRDEVRELGNDLAQRGYVSPFEEAEARLLAAYDAGTR